MVTASRGEPDNGCLHTYMFNPLTRKRQKTALRFVKKQAFK